MSTEWKPPAYGTPVWFSIPATNVGRASEFYDAVFKLPFKKEQDPAYPKDECNAFDLNPSLNLSGGILKAPDTTGYVKPSHGGVMIYWFVEDVDAIAPVIEKAGGKMLTEKVKEGEYGVYRMFEDTEGTVGAVYMMAGK